MSQAAFPPGMNFFQDMLTSTGQGLTGIGAWMAPTLDPAELDKRISELRTVHFWLEQNSKMVATSIQALEVQRMTLTTLGQMNVAAADVQRAWRAPGGAAVPTPEASAAKAESVAPASATRPSESAGPPTPAADPSAWWGALTQQFSQLATQAMRTGADMAQQAQAAVNTPAQGDESTAVKAKRARASARSTAAPARKRAPSRRAP